MAAVKAGSTYIVEKFNKTGAVILKSQFLIFSIVI